MVRIILAAIVTTAISGCTVRHVPPTPEEAAAMEWDAVWASTRRGYAEGFQTIPFAEGPISVVAADVDELSTYRLVPCGTQVCGGSAHGPRGHVHRTLDYWVVRGLYGREFWLSPGGDGGLRRHGRPDAWLAWETVAPPPMGG